MIHPGLILALQIIVLFVCSRSVMESLFRGIRRTTGNTSVSFYILSLIYLPGTIVHEMSHALTSVMLFVPPESVSFIPEVAEDSDRLSVRFGSVIHRRTDPFRSMLIGLAPLAGGFCFFALLALSNVFPSQSMAINLLIIYLSLSISGSMFPSRQDIRHSIMIVPLIILATSAVLAFDIPLVHFLSTEHAKMTLSAINTFLYVPTLAHIVTWLLLRMLKTYAGRMQ